MNLTLCLFVAYHDTSRLIIVMVTIFHLFAGQPQQPEDDGRDKDAPRLLDKGLPIMSDECDHKDHDGFTCHYGYRERRCRYRADAGCDIDQRGRREGKAVQDEDGRKAFFFDPMEETLGPRHSFLYEQSQLASQLTNNPEYRNGS